ncbi:MAG TPA: bifunctional phosphoserine phosphatase/homoserine phosphotransferase ThrH [Bacteroidales bacterium]|nr:bifunctional phosphoserine phosphatase/homoserine phosphotransferase ThrH [Bacteroidales bacterium]HPS72767.1 bifunctional phosphoserine phosphatase/homoserine phosphotransferase ThrH [Bacteroidales bacterium]
MYILCSDLEGVFVPEVWINVAEKTGIPELRRTTRDEPDYDKLMHYRMKILDEHGLKLRDIQEVIARIRPLPGALDFIQWVKERTQLIIVSDTFIQFADPMMKQLGRPTLFCHTLVTDDTGRIIDYRLRQADPKRKTVEALQSLNYQVIAMGDSYNDISMLKQADAGILFRPPSNVVADYPRFPVAEEYRDLETILQNYLP